MNNCEAHLDLFAEARQAYSVLDVWNLLNLEGEPKLGVNRSPFREDKHPSLSIFEGGKAWKDHASGEGGDVVSLIARAVSGSCDGYSEARQWLLERLGIDHPGWHPGTPRRYRPVEKRREDKPVTPPTMALPPLDGGTPEERVQVAQSRCIHVDAVEFGVMLGTIRFGYWIDSTGKEYKEQGRCWVLTDASGMMAEARRVDGQKFFGKNKSLSFPKGCFPSDGGKRWPVGVQSPALVKAGKKLGPPLSVMLVEGGPDYLAACYLALSMKGKGILPVAILGAGTKEIHPQALKLFKGVRVRMFPHVGDSGEVGEKAAQLWAEQLHDAGAIVDVFDFSGLTRRDGKPVTDLNDAVIVCDEQRAELERDLQL